MATPCLSRPCARTALLPILLGATLLVATTAPAADAAVIASSVSGFEGGPALASDGRVVVGERRGNGALRIVAIDPTTRAGTVMIAFPPLADPATFPTLSVTGTGGIVTATLSTFRAPSDPEAEHATPAVLSTRTMTILPILAPLASCSSGLSPSPMLGAAGGDGFVATIGDECGLSRTAVRLRTAAGTLTIPATAGPADSSFPPDIAELRATGPVVAWVQTRSPAVGAQLERTLVVAVGTTGEVLLREPLDAFPYLFGLGSDGTVALNTMAEFPCAMRVASPASPSLHRVQLTGGPCAFFIPHGALAVAGGRMVFSAFGGYAVSDLQGVARPLSEAGGLPGESPVAFDGSTVFVVRKDCDADRLLAISADGSGAPLTAPISATGPCPVRRSGPGRQRVARDGHVKISLRCKTGCRGTLRLLQRGSRGRERVVGSAGYVSGPGKVAVRVAVARYARALAGCSRGLRVALVVFPVGDVRRELGEHRIVSGARCRRAGGPAFTAPEPRPRT